MSSMKHAEGATPEWAADAVYRLLEATTTEEVNVVLQAYPEFLVAENWQNYGGVPKNWDRVGVQTSEPVGALAEVIINSIDAILMRKAHEHGISEESADAPRDMREAVKRFFPEVIEGRLARLSLRQRTDLAEKSVQIAIKRNKKAKKFPTYTIVDFGEGQNPSKFPDTLLSLGAKNKEGIPFVQGRFNMGSTGSITFCTRADIRNRLYKFILSKRTLDDADGRWGWTLIRVRPTTGSEALPVVEYFAPNKCVPEFKAPQIEAFGRSDIGIVDGGTVVQLYEYDIGPVARNVDLGLHDALTTSLLDSALPVRLFDFGAEPMPKDSLPSEPGPDGIYMKLRIDGIAARTFAGMGIVLRSGESPDSESEETLDISKMIQENSSNPDLGTIKIYAFGVAKMKKHLRRYPYRVFYTVNGQTQGKERASFFRKANLDDLRSHLIVQVDCNQMNNTARSVIFKPDRERMADTELTREMKNIVLGALKGDSDLKLYANEIRKRRVKETMDEDETSKEFFQDLVRNSPELKELFGLGNVVSSATKKSGGDDDWKGERYPKFLRPIGLEDGGEKIVPINAYRRIECETDAENEYLSRSNDPGELIHPSADILPNDLSGLRNGKLRITIRAPRKATVGDEIPCEFGFNDSSRPDPLTFRVRVKIGEPEQPASNPSGSKRDGTKSKIDDALAFPNIQWVEQEDWDEYDFDEESGATVRKSEDKATILVNKANRHLEAIIMRESDEAEQEMCRHLFKIGVGILTLAMYKRMIDTKDNDDSDNGDSEKAMEQASAAIAAHIITLIQRLGGKRI